MSLASRRTIRPPSENASAVIEGDRTERNVQTKRECQPQSNTPDAKERDRIYRTRLLSKGTSAIKRDTRSQRIWPHHRGSPNAALYARRIRTRPLVPEPTATERNAHINRNASRRAVRATRKNATAVIGGDRSQRTRPPSKGTPATRTNASRRVARPTPINATAVTGPDRLQKTRPPSKTIPGGSNERPGTWAPTPVRDRDHAGKHPGPRRLIAQMTERRRITRAASLRPPCKPRRDAALP